MDRLTIVQQEKEVGTGGGREAGGGGGQGRIQSEVDQPNFMQLGVERNLTVAAKLATCSAPRVRFSKVLKRFRALKAISKRLVFYYKGEICCKILCKETSSFLRYSKEARKVSEVSGNARLVPRTCWHQGIVLILEMQKLDYAQSTTRNALPSHGVVIKLQKRNLVVVFVR